jgi:UDP-N-acetylmuramyl pentapeptide synthase
VDVVAVGELALQYGAERWVEDAAEAVLAVEEIVRPGDAVLVKASRAIGLEGIPAQLANFAGRWST